MYINMYIHVWVYVCACVCVCVYWVMIWLIHDSSYIFTYIYIYIYTHTHINMYIHVCIYVRVCVCVSSHDMTHSVLKSFRFCVFVTRLIQVTNYNSLWQDLYMQIVLLWYSFFLHFFWVFLMCLVCDMTHQGILLRVAWCTQVTRCRSQHPFRWNTL